MLRAKVFQLVARIPPGAVMTYAQVARAVGRPGTARAVGNALGTNRNTRAVPCHRVVCSDGRVGGYAFGARNKVKLLQREGVSIRRGRIYNLPDVRWRPD